MGNVHAGAAPSPPPMGFQPPPEPKDTLLQATPAGPDVLENPGTMEDLHKKCKGEFNFEVSIVECAVVDWVEIDRKKAVIRYFYDFINGKFERAINTE